MELYLQSLQFTAGIVTPIFVIVLLGFLLRRGRLIDEAFINTSSRLVFMVALPTLVFMSIARTDFQAMFNPALLGFVFVATLASFLAIWWLAARWIKAPGDLGAFVQGAFRSNFGIIGMALSYNLFGNSGLSQAAMILALIIPMYNVLSVVVLTVTMNRGSTEGVSLRQILRAIALNPLIIAVVLALPFSYYGLHLPAALDTTGKYFANLTLPLALLAIGGALDLKSLRNSSITAFWATSTKLLILPLLVVPLAALLGFEGVELALLFVLFSCPTAAAAFVMARAMGANAQLSANIILTTTLGSIVTLSAGIFVLRLLGVI
ncbi:AEC family transporter [Marinobacterium rhizophilum]|uniref:AEC family transporter n=1 Tax=Marinobacterium rhizophilum TaxID=420402 RepID=A0ABY5HGT2_9GAMM|nr:AEC family transporter [Marinobacterium rhizophilum]UTW11500.1 AEC family transporter [Marinobacterium rhizophilum]